MFRKRLIVLLCVFGAISLLAVARLFQFQILWHERYQAIYRQPIRRETTLETCRGAVRTAEGRPLAYDELVFNLAVRYPNLLYDHTLRHAVWDERMRSVRAHAGLDRADAAACAACHLPGGSTPASRRKLRRQKGKCAECHADARDWKAAAARVTGRSLAALSEEVDELVERVERVRASVARRTGNPRVRIPEQLSYHVLAEDLPVESAMLIETRAQAYPGVRIEITRRRTVSDGTLAPHVLGTVGPISAEQWTRLKDEGLTWRPGVPSSDQPAAYRKDDVLGRSGVERVYEPVLRGLRGWRTRRILIRTLRIERAEEERAPVPGHNVILTLDEALQRAATAALAEAAAGPHQLTRGAAVVLHPETGAVLAMATWPTYDSNRYGEPEYTRETLSNTYGPLLSRPIAGQLPPGSVFKLITATAGLEEGEITPHGTIHCAGYLTVGGRRFRCHGPDGSLDVVDAIRKSCNVYFYTTAARVGGEKLAAWARRFGLGEETGIDLPYEKKGNVPVPASISGMYNMGIGQGRLLVTPLQVARLVSVFANGGYLVRPHVLSTIEDDAGRLVQRWDPQRTKLPIRGETIALVRRGMAGAVDSGTARHSGLAEYEAAGKTGTAELWSGSRVNHAWFAGYLPRTKPRFAFAVVCERVESQGGRIAADVVRRMFEKYYSETGGNKGN
jgi:penicillin-binding protein 2